MQDADALFTLATAVKDRVAAYYLANGWSLPGQGGEDGVQQVVPGLPAYDCQMLAVHVSQVDMHAGDPNATQPQIWPGVGYQMRVARVLIYVVRCVPSVTDNGDPPSVTDTEAAALAILSDPTRVWNAMLDAVNDGYLPRKSVTQQGWQALEPSGGLGGGVLTVAIDTTDWV